MMRVAVVMGGDSSEREVSLASGQAVFDGLDRSKYAPVAVELTCTPQSVAELPEVLRERQVDLAFLTLHGGAGEDGRIQQLLEAVGLPYTGSGPQASRLAMDKIISRRVFQQAGLTPPRGKEFLCLEEAQFAQAAAEVLGELGLPAVVKPACEGSTIGISIVRTAAELQPALAEARRYGPDVLVEEFVAGVELTATVLGSKTPRALPLIEIVPQSGFYDYHAKYVAEDTGKIVPARLSAEMTQLVQQQAVAGFSALGCRGCARIDFIVTDDTAYVLEANTIPGMIGDHSLVPCAARAVGLSFSALLDEIISLAQEEGPNGP